MLHCLEVKPRMNGSLIIKKKKMKKEKKYFLDCTDEQLQDAQVATERALMSKIFKEAFYPNGMTDVGNDQYVIYFAFTTFHV